MVAGVAGWACPGWGDNRPDNSASAGSVPPAPAEPVRGTSKLAPPSRGASNLGVDTTTNDKDVHRCQDGAVTGSLTASGKRENGE